MSRTDYAAGTATAHEVKSSGDIDMAEEMQNEFMKRGYLLPNGCKDLIDALKANAQPTPVPQKRSVPMPSISGEIIVPPDMNVGELAEALSQKPFKIIADLMGLGVFANISQQLEFEMISKVMRMYGFTAKRAG